MIKVLIVDDSFLMQETLAFILGGDTEFEIVGYANNGEEAISLVKEKRPDVITMDWQMPKLNGQQATKIIMETMPTPIVVVTGSIAANDVTVSFSLMEAGALAIVKKPHSPGHPLYESETRELLSTLKLMSEVKLVRRVTQSMYLRQNGQPSMVKKQKRASQVEIVVVGASTGGPIALNRMLSASLANFPVPILIVQHISQGFTQGFVEWLMNTTNLPVHLAYDGEVALPGHVYVAPDNHHMGIKKGLKIYLSKESAINGLRPSVAFLFQTAAEHYGASAVGVLLTGMGRDGAEELKLLRDKGAITFAQDKQSSVVHGMPGEAIKLNAAVFIMSPEDIAPKLWEVVENRGVIKTS